MPKQQKQQGKAERKKEKGYKGRPQPPGGPVRKGMVAVPCPRVQRGDKKAVPSHLQLARLLCNLYLPKWHSHILDEMRGLTKAGSKSNNTKKAMCVGKTPLEWILKVLPPVQQSLPAVDRIACLQLLEADGDGFLLECVLNRKKKADTKKSKAKVESQFSENIPMCTYPINEGSDNQWSTVILVVPQASVFYLASHGDKVNSNESRVGFHTLPMSWLRIHRKTGTPASGSFIKSIQSVTRLHTGKIDRSTTVMPAYQLDDFEDGAPLLAPDFYRTKEPRSIGTQAEARQVYNCLLNEAKTSGSFRYGCRRYIRGSVHSQIPATCFVLDQTKMGNVVMPVTVRDIHGRVGELSYVQVTSALKEFQLLHQLQLASARIRGKASNCRQHAGDSGKMFALGEMKIAGVAGLTVTKATDYVSGGGLLPSICRKSAAFAEKELRGILPAMHNLEREAGRSPIPEMGGVHGPTCTNNVSCDLENASHYDVGDGSIGYSIWVELVPGEASNWFFVLPNILINVGGTTFQGIAIKLFHGVCIAWDGRVIRHGTSLTQRNSSSDDVGQGKKGPNSCFGWFWAADMKSAQVAMEINAS